MAITVIKFAEFEGPMGGSLTTGILLRLEGLESPDAAPQRAVRLRVADTRYRHKDGRLGDLFRIDTGVGRPHDGTGLGLVICRRLAVLLGGRFLPLVNGLKGPCSPCRYHLTASLNYEPHDFID